MTYEEHQSTSASGEAYRYLRDQIFSGKFAAGRRLKPEDISRALGLSRMPVREAIRQLEGQGLVTIRPNRGAVVTSLTPDEIVELFEMRAALEGLAIRKALPNIFGHWIEDLDALKQRMDRVRGEPNLWIERHHDFHDMICQLSKRPRLAAQVRNLRDTLRPYLLMYMNVFQDSDTGFEHETIMAVIANGDPAAAERAMEQHVMDHARELVEFLHREGPPACPEESVRLVSRKDEAASRREHD